MNSDLVSAVSQWKKEGKLTPGCWLAIWWPQGSVPKLIACYPQRQELSYMTVQVWKDLFLVQCPDL